MSCLNIKNSNRFLTYVLEHVSYFANILTWALIWFTQLKTFVARKWIKNVFQAQWSSLRQSSNVFSSVLFFMDISKILCFFPSVMDLHSDCWKKVRNTLRSISAVGLLDMNPSLCTFNEITPYLKINVRKRVAFLLMSWRFLGKGSCIIQRLIHRIFESYKHGNALLLVVNFIICFLN